MSTVQVLAEMASNVWKVEVAVGDRVDEGDTLLVLESMKMEIPIEAPVAGTVTALHVEPGQNVPEDHLLVTLQP